MQQEKSVGDRPRPVAPTPSDSAMPAVESGRVKGVRACHMAGDGYPTPMMLLGKADSGQRCVSERAAHTRNSGYGGQDDREKEPTQRRTHMSLSAFPGFAWVRLGYGED